MGRYLGRKGKESSDFLSPSLLFPPPSVAYSLGTEISRDLPYTIDFFYFDPLKNKRQVAVVGSGRCGRRRKKISLLASLQVVGHFIYILI